MSALSLVWITGASTGIGAALVHAFDEGNYRVVLSARRQDQLEAVRNACHHPERHVVFPLDQSDPADVEARTLVLRDTIGVPDIIVLNGGVSQRAMALDTEVAVSEHLFRVNVLANVAICKAMVPSMVARGSGHIGVVSSLVGKFGSPLRSSYSASKHALHGYFESARAEWHDKGVGITMVCPGFIRTDISLNAVTGTGERQNKMDDAQASGMSPEACALQIVEAITKRKAVVYIGGRERLAIYVHRWLPALFRVLIRRTKVT